MATNQRLTISLKRPPASVEWPPWTKALQSETENAKEAQAGVLFSPKYSPACSWFTVKAILAPSEAKVTGKTRWSSWLETLVLFRLSNERFRLEWRKRVQPQLAQGKC